MKKSFLLLALCLNVSTLAAQAKFLTLCDDVSDPVSLDPHFVFDNKAYNILNQVYEGLIRLDGDGRIVPSLADRWERVDDRSVRFYLRDAVKFHDGNIFDASVVEKSLKRQLRLQSPVTAQLASIEQIIAESTGTVLIRTRMPDAVLLYKLAVFALVVPPNLAEQDSALATDAPPIGTGPFMFVSWVRGKSLTLKANPDYWKKGKTYFEGLTFAFLPEDKQIDSLIKGEIDLLTDVPGTRTIIVAQEKGLRIIKKRALATHAFWFTSFRGPLKNAEIRRALNLALNKEELIRFAAFGNGYPLATLSMSGETGHNSQLKPYPFDAQAARAALESADLPRDFTIRLLAVQQSEREAKIVKAQLEKIGLKVELTVVPIAEGFQIVSDGRIRNYDITANLAPDVISHMSFLAGVCFFSQSPMSAGGIPGFDERFIEMLSEPDSERHRKAAEELDAWIHDQALGLFTYQRIRTYGIRGHIRFQPPITGILDLATIGQDAEN